jgi:2-keto-4-pentenoate hydratase/2-oxohepta-3-ene-1,7-dioic acid hydratase in catechol pathway
MIHTVSEGCALPVGKIVAVGRNYAAHAAEMGAPRPREPLLFLKPSTALLLGGGTLRLPPWTSEVHHEVELVVRIGRGGTALSASASEAAADAFAVGLDLTARDVQRRAKEAGHPWAVAKGWDGSAPLSSLRPLRHPAEIADLELRLEVNGQVRQRGCSAGMLWSVPELISFISHRFRLEPGDLLFTGTPEGVGPVRPGDHLRATLEDALVLEVEIAG